MALYQEVNTRALPATGPSKKFRNVDELDPFHYIDRSMLDVIHDAM